VPNPYKAVCFRTYLTSGKPGFILTAGFDPLRDEASEYAGLLEKNDVPVTWLHERSDARVSNHGTNHPCRRYSAGPRCSSVEASIPRALCDVDVKNRHFRKSNLCALYPAELQRRMSAFDVKAS
jgi:acetyl esterase/lipase